MRIYDEYGNLTDCEVVTFSADLATQVGDLTSRLFEEGMTILEARALINYLCTSVEFAIVMPLMLAQAKAKGCDDSTIQTEENDCD